MPLGVRDIMLVVRARNEAQGIIRDVSRMLSQMDSGARAAGQSMMTVGAGLTAVGVGFIAAGAAGLSFFHETENAAVEYQRQVALTLTQTDGLGASLQDIGDIAKRVARDIPAPFDQMQKTLYDIFSSMNVNVQQSETLLRAFSKGAVAGQVDIQAAARASIAIMNSYKIPVEDVNRVMDIQFQLVRKGVGTYQEFSSVLGQVTPAAVAAGQSIESMAGMLAFLTRNGLSTSMAATSAARAMELLTNPDVTANLEKIGVRTKDASGEFLQMRDIIRQLVEDKGWGKLTGPQLKQAFEDTFGHGTIQARRFFDLAIPNFEELNSLTDDMSNSAGAMDAAYGTMSTTTASRLQELNNRFDILKVNIGEKLLPNVERLVGVFMNLINAWENLSPGTQDLILKFALVATVVAIVVGAVTTVVGIFLILAGAAAAAGVALSTVGLVIAGVVVAFLAIVGIIVAVIIHWDTLKNAVTTAWNAITNATSTAKDAIVSAVGTIVNWITGTLIPTIKDGLGNAWNWVTDKINTFLGFLNNTVKPIVESVVNFIIDKFNEFANWWGLHVTPIIEAVGELFKAIGARVQEAMNTIWNVIQIGWDIIQNVFNFALTNIRNIVSATWNDIVRIFNTAMEIIKPIVQTGWNFLTQTISDAMHGIWNIIQVAWDIIQNIFHFGVDTVKTIWQIFGDAILSSARFIWDGIKGVIEGGLKAIQGIIQVVTGIISGDWSKVWQGISNIAAGVWQAITSIVQNGGNVIRSFLSAILNTISTIWNTTWNSVKSVVGTVWNAITQVVSEKVNAIVGFVTGLKDRILGVLRGIDLFGIGRSIMESLLNGLKSAWEAVAGFLGGLADTIKRLKGPPEKDAKLLMGNGQLIMDSLGKGLDRGWQDVQKQLMGYNPQITGSIYPTQGPVGSLQGTGAGAGATFTISEGAFVIHIDNATEDTEQAVQRGIQAAFAQLTDEWAGFRSGTP